MLKAQATARGIDVVAKAIAEGSENAHSAVSLSVAEKYVEAFSNLAREGTAVVVPGNVGDLGGMIANAMAVYGKVNQSQARSIAAKALGVQEPAQIEHSHQQKAKKNTSEPERQAESETDKVENVADSVLEGFDQASQQRR
jgi:ribosomal protein L18E